MYITDIDSIKLYSFDKLLRLYSSIRNDKNVSNHFGVMTDQLLDEVYIKIKLEMVSSIEYIVLKQITSSIHVDTISIDNSAPSLKNEELDLSMKNLIDLRKDILNDSGKTLDTSLIPASCIYMDIECLLKSNSILFLCDGILEQLLVEPKTGTLRDITSIKKYIISNFDRQFFNFMRSSLGKVDQVSKMIKQEMFYDFIPSTINSVTPIRVVGPNGVIQLSGGKSDEVSKELSNMRATSELENSYIEFGVCSNFYTFLIFSVTTDYVVSHESLIDVINYNKIYINEDMYGDYKARIISIVRKFVENRQKILEDERMSIARYYTLLCGDKIKYKLRIPIVGKFPHRWRYVLQDNDTATITNKCNTAILPFSDAIKSDFK